MKRLLIFGARGFLGGWLQSSARSSYEVFSSDQEGRVDIADPAACRRIFDTVQPNHVVLLAAMSDIDACDRNPQLAEAVNVRGPENIAGECKRTGAHLLYSSSGAVFDGEAEAYVESDEPTPVNVYGRTKAQAESVVAGIVQDATIVRLSLVLGRAQGTSNSILDKLLRWWGNGETVRMPTEETRNAIDAETVAKLLLDLIGNPAARGIYHIGSQNPLSRLEMTRLIAIECGFSPDVVQPLTEYPPNRARRGKREFLRTEKIAAACPTPIPTCEEAIRRCAHVTAQSHS